MKKLLKPCGWNMEFIMTCKSKLKTPAPLILSGNRSITTSNPVFVMGILNINNDSFWEGSRAASVDSALRIALKMVEDGADIIDIGGESTRPGAWYISAEEELKRIIPVIREIRKHSQVVLSCDTRKSDVFRAAFEAGADILNDISALQDDSFLAGYCSQVDCPVILMHKKGIPLTMQNNPGMRTPVKEVKKYLENAAKNAVKMGIKKSKIIIDPGIGFGKTYNDNISLIRGTGEIAKAGYPVLMALSRKTVIGDILNCGIQDRLYGTIAANMISVLKGASIIRVHDVKAHTDFIKIFNELL